MSRQLFNYFECGALGKLRESLKKPGPKSKDGNNLVLSDNDKKIFEKAIKKFHIKKKMS